MRPQGVIKCEFRVQTARRFDENNSFGWFFGPVGQVFFGASVLRSEDIRRTSHRPSLALGKVLQPLALGKVLQHFTFRKMFPQACMPFATSAKSSCRPAKHFRRPKKVSAGMHAFCDVRKKFLQTCETFSPSEKSYRRCACLLKHPRKVPAGQPWLRPPLRGWIRNHSEFLHLRSSELIENQSLVTSSGLGLCVPISRIKKAPSVKATLNGATSVRNVWSRIPISK